MKEWRQEGIRGIWLKLSKENSHLIDIAVKEEGFEYHHSKKDHLVLTKWLPKDEPDKLPGYATHYVGVGGLVLSADR